MSRIEVGQKDWEECLKPEWQVTAALGGAGMLRGSLLSFPGSAQGWGQEKRIEKNLVDNKISSPAKRKVLIPPTKHLKPVMNWVELKYQHTPTQFNNKGEGLSSHATPLRSHGSLTGESECLDSSFYWCFVHKVWHRVKHYEALWRSHKKRPSSREGLQNQTQSGPDVGSIREGL